jgi:ribonuclease G
VVQSHPKTKLTLRSHPFVVSFFRQGLPSRQMKWFMKYYKWINLASDSDMGIMEYKFFDNNEDEIRL